MRAVLLTAEAGSTEIVGDLLAQGADGNLRGQRKKSALMLAGRDGLVEGVRLLLAAGAKGDLKDANGNTALVMAAREAQSEVIAGRLWRGWSPGRFVFWWD